MNTSLNGRVALVTGSSHGLGLEIAKVLAKNGARLIICARSWENLEEAAYQVESISVEKIVNAYLVDGTSGKSVKEMFDFKIKSHGGVLDILVNNIGGATKFGTFEDLTDKDWIKTFDLNVMSAVRFTRGALPLLKKSRHGGRIINISSFVALKPGKFNPDYSASKAAIVNFTEYIARNYGKDGIHANAICPNTLMGDGLERNAEDRALKEGISVEEAKNKIIESAKKKNPLGEIGEPADVANLVAFLASDAAKFINGTCIPVDGGGLTQT